MYHVLDTNIHVMLTRGEDDMTDKLNRQLSQEDNLLKLAQAMKEARAQIEREQIMKRMKYGKAAKKAQREHQQ